MSSPPATRRFTTAEYYRMVAAGILGEDDRVELVDGRVVEMTPIGPRHAGCVKEITRLLYRALGDAVIIGVQDPVTLGDGFEPQPDVLVLRRPPEGFRRRHPGPADVLLLIEVSDASLEYDRGTKVPLYARAGIAEVWIVDLDGARIEVYRTPSGEGYRDVRAVSRGEMLSPSAFPDVVIPAAEVLD